MATITTWAASVVAALGLGDVLGLGGGGGVDQTDGGGSGSDGGLDQALAVCVSVGQGVVGVDKRRQGVD